MRKLILFAVFALLSNMAYSQSYDIKFKIVKESTEKMGYEWDYEFKDAKHNPPYYVEFNGETLKISSSSTVYINKKVSTIKVNERTKTVYGKEVITGKDLILGIEEKDEKMWHYYTLRYIYLESGGYAIFLYCPYITDDGMVYSYDIYRSEIIE